MQKHTEEAPEKGHFQIRSNKTGPTNENQDFTFAKQESTAPRKYYGSAIQMGEMKAREEKVVAQQSHTMSQWLLTTCHLPRPRTRIGGLMFKLLFFVGDV